MPTPLALGLLWWFTLGGLGLFFPYYSLYLRENIGLEGTQVGLVLAAIPCIGLVAQPLWGQIGDRTGKRTRVVTILTLGTGAGYLALGHTDGFLMLLACTAGLACFSTALIPNCVAVTLALAKDDRGFGRARVMGTLAFGVSVVSLPYALRLFQQHGLARPAATPEGEAGLGLIFGCAAGFLAMATLVSLILRSPASTSPRAHRGQWRQLFRDPAFIRVLAFTFLAFLFMQGPTILFPILVRDQGGGIEALSHMWILMLLLEVPLVYHFGATLEMFGVRGVIQIGMLAAAIRWGISGLTQDLGWIYAVQILHGVSVWGVVLGAPLYVNQVVPPELRSTGQGLLAMLGVSLGSMLSNLTAGWLIDAYGAQAPAQFGGLGALLLTLALPRLLPDTRAEAPEPVDPTPSRALARERD